MSIILLGGFLLCYENVCWFTICKAAHLNLNDYENSTKFSSPHRHPLIHSQYTISMIIHCGKYTNPILQCNLKMFLLRYRSQNRSKSSIRNSCCLPTSSLHHHRLNNACRFIIASHVIPRIVPRPILCVHTTTTPFNSPHWIVELCDCVKMMRFGFVVYLISLAGPFRYNEGFCYKPTTSCALRCEVRNFVCVYLYNIILWV